MGSKRTPERWTNGACALVTRGRYFAEIDFGVRSSLVTAPGCMLGGKGATFRPFGVYGPFCQTFPSQLRRWFFSFPQNRRAGILVYLFRFKNHWISSFPEIPFGLDQKNTVLFGQTCGLGRTSRHHGLGAADQDGGHAVHVPRARDLPGDAGDASSFKSPMTPKPTRGCDLFSFE